MQRRRLLQATSLSLCASALPMGGSRAQNRYSKYAGQTVRICVPVHPHYDAMLKLLPLFTQQTGIKVDVDRQPLSQLKTAQLAQLNKPQSDHDLLAYVVMWKSEYVAKGLIQPLPPFLTNNTLADPSFDIGDIVPIYLENLGLVGGHKGYLSGRGAVLYGLPYGAETSVLAYRKDVFAKLNLSVPNHYAELGALLHRLHDSGGIRALASRGQQGHHVVHAWLLHLNPLGGSVFNGVWQPMFNDKFGVQALKFLQDVVQTGPAGIAHHDQAQSAASFLQGEAAMYLDSTTLAGQLNAPQHAKMANQVGWALHPMGTRRASQSGGLGLAIASRAVRADAAFLLMQWLTAKTQDQAVTRLGGVPIRNSTMADPDLLRQYPEFELFRQALKYANPDWRPIIPVWDSINVQALGVGLHQAITGQKSAESALNGLVPLVKQIMREAGYLKS